MPKKFLIIRFSSIGDIIQCMTVVDGIKNHYPDAEIHWIARKDMSSFLAMDDRITKIWGFDRKAGFKGLWKQAKELKKEKFDYVGKVGLLRIDLHSDYETQTRITEILEMIDNNFPEAFEINSIITKAVPLAENRIKALTGKNYQKLKQLLWLLMMRSSLSYIAIV